MKTKLEILEETINYYSNNTERLGTINGASFYITHNGKMCAIGRCLKDPKKIQNKCGHNTVDQIENLEEELKEEYQGHDLDFWWELQELHDDPRNWSVGGLTKPGNELVQTLKRQFS